MKKNIALAILGCASLLAVSASANTTTFDTASGSTVGNPPLSVSAEGTFTTGAGTLTVTLTDLLANPTSVAQLISDVAFTFDRSISDSGTSLASASGTGVNVAANGTTSAGTVSSTAWALTGFHLSALGGGQPEGLIIGPAGAGGVYTAANNSIAGNGPHNPFYSGSATFVLNIPGLTAADSVNTATFSFGTTAGVDVPGVPHIQVPDGGTTVLLLGAALSGLGLVRRKLS